MCRFLGLDAPAKAVCGTGLAGRKLTGERFASPVHEPPPARLGGAFRPHRLVALARGVAIAFTAAVSLICMPGAMAGDAAAGRQTLDSLPPLTGPVLLTISGNLGRTNTADTAQFDLAMLEALPLTTVVTNTPWRDEPARFEGVRLSDLLAAVDAGSAEFLAVGLDDYEVEFTGVDVESNPVIVAYREDDRALSVRTLGPLRIMFPFDDSPELLNQSNMTMSVWQLSEMRVH